jgi:ribosomal protein S18 acetylase RimI-like enzyme
MVPAIPWVDGALSMTPGCCHGCEGRGGCRDRATGEGVVRRVARGSRADCPGGTHPSPHAREFSIPASGSTSERARRGPSGDPVGFCIVTGAELYQLYVSARSRGSGVSAALIADAEARLSESGVQTAWLACAIGNERAARFYEKRGWSRVGTMVYRLDASAGASSLEVLRYEKSVRGKATNAAPQGGRI